MAQENQFRTNQEITWCPGCGNFGIWGSLQQALRGIGLDPGRVFVSYGIGCHGHMVNYLKTYGFEGVHGRALPLAIGVKIAKPELTVLAVAGDGDQLGEGGNHLIHAARRNPDLTLILHNNQLYSLTVGQASPTSDKGSRTRSAPQGVFDEPLNPLALGIAAGASFAARAFAGRVPELTSLLVQAIRHRGFSLLEVLQPCPSLNRVNTFQWFNERIYELGPGHDSKNKIAAFEKALEWGEKIPLGIFYQEIRPTLEDNLGAVSFSERKIARQLVEFQ